ncbi:hypothetical protein FS749_009149 [Ceratobasidium sp. UAMH 11750]|nr:hypothetical protein FS749_009149 [Ceratobasidium sp. UAMH 11750]
MNSMWNLDTLPGTDSGALPPPRHFDDMLADLRITFLPKTQRKAVHVADGVRVVEPTLALYCPIEGGEYVIDLTVKELAQKAGAEVQVVDMAQVAAGEWGSFGKVASGFRLMHNPLGRVKLGGKVSDDDDSSDNRAAFEPFWRALADSDPPEPAAGSGETLSSSKRPRIIYIRDFGLLSSRSQVWFPSLYSAVRARRIGSANTDSPISNPTTIIFGVSPPIDPDKTTGYEYSSSPSKDWEEGASKERARRLKNRKEKWDKGTLLKELPSFEPRIKIPKPKNENETGNAQDLESSTGDSSFYEQELKGYFGSYVVVPAARNASLERAARQKRRRELNDLMLRMAIGVKGAEVEQGVAPTTEESEDLTKEWGEHLLTSGEVDDMANRSVTMAVISSEADWERSLVTWTQLLEAWRAKKLCDEERKAWTSADD